jgi:hypothetical protein
VPLKKVFLSFSFRDADRELVGMVDQLVMSHQLTRVTGRRLEGQNLTEAIREKINTSDGLIALLTRRDERADGSWTTHDWVRDELNFARQAGIQAIALLEEGVVMSGAFSDHERIHFSREDLPAALLAVSETLGLWKRRVGRKVKVSIVADDLVSNSRFLGGQMRVEYRFIVGGDVMPWQPVTPILEIGGPVVYLSGTQDGYMIQLQVVDGPDQWISRATPELIEIDLEKITGGA